MCVCVSRCLCLSQTEVSLLRSEVRDLRQRLAERDRLVERALQHIVVRVDRAFEAFSLDQFSHSGSLGPHVCICQNAGMPICCQDPERACPYFGKCRHLRTALVPY